MTRESKKALAFLHYTEGLGGYPPETLDDDAWIALHSHYEPRVLSLHNVVGLHDRDTDSVEKFLEKINKERIARYDAAIYKAAKAFVASYEALAVCFLNFVLLASVVIHFLFTNSP